MNSATLHKQLVQNLATFCLVLSLALLYGCGPKVIEVAPMPSGNQPSAAKVVSTASSQLGVRYRAGGTTPSGFDCSGLLWWTYKQHGVSIPRMTVDQANAGYGVDPKAMKLGDILVFRTRQGKHGLHTGLYAGNGQFVHSPGSGKRVRKDLVNDSYWKPRLIRVRRILQ